MKARLLGLSAPRALDRGVLRWVYALGDPKFLTSFFRAVSRLGDGAIWYALMLAIPLIYGAEQLRLSVTLAVTGLAAVLIYKALKAAVRRPRPCSREDGPLARVNLLDEWSFPSGHTLHAVAFTTVAVSALPLLAWLLVPFTIAIALSRLVLGVHYPSDVIAGALIGFAIARLSQIVVGV